MLVAEFENRALREKRVILNLIRKQIGTVHLDRFLHQCHGKIADADALRLTL